VTAVNRSEGLELRTDRLILRELSDSDFEAVHAYGSDPEVVAFVPWGPNTEHETRTFLQQTSERVSSRPRLHHVLGIVVADRDQLVGTVGLYQRPEDQGQAMLGYVLSVDAWGHGYATEASATMLELGFLVLDLRRIWAACDPDNRASIRVLEKIGMTREGLLRDDTLIRGRVRDTLRWGILEREWHAGTLPERSRE
jgi:RimJ/RimL family protein N-acetyltransferase